MLKLSKLACMLALVLPLAFVACEKTEEEPYDVTADFQQIDLPEGFDNDAGTTGYFRESAVKFLNTYGYDADYDYYYWSGFACSRMHDLTTAGIENEFSAYVAGDDDNQFMVAFVGTSPVAMEFDNPVKDLEFYVTNTTYAALSMKNGDAFAKQFTDDDWFELHMQAFDAAGNELFTDPETNEPLPQKIPLAQGTQILNAWSKITISGGAVSRIEFTLASSDTGTWGMNTPAYFCLDNLRARTVK